MDKSFEPVNLARMGWTDADRYECIARTWAICAGTNLEVCLDPSGAVSAGMDYDPTPEDALNLWKHLRERGPPEMMRHHPANLRDLVTRMGSPPPGYEEVHAVMLRFTAIMEEIAEIQIAATEHPRIVLARIAPMKAEAISLLSRHRRLT